MTTESLILAVFGTVFASVAVFVMGIHIDRLWRSWRGEHVMRHIVAICTIIPVWALLSWLCVVFPHKHNGILVVIDSYEALVVYNFMELMKEYLGGFHAAARKLSTVPPFRLFRCLWLVQPDEKFLKILQFLVYQFCVLKPILAVVRFFLEHIGRLNEEGFNFGPNFWITFIRVLSLMAAMMALFTFYRCCSKALNRFNIVLKFAVIKILITIHIAQGIGFKMLTGLGWIEDRIETAEIRSIRIQYLLSAAEMMILSYFVIRAYPAYEKTKPMQDEIGLENFQFVTQDVPSAFDADGEDPPMRNQW